MALEYAFEMAASSIRFGRGVTREIGMDLAEMGVQKVMVLTDARSRSCSRWTPSSRASRDNRITHASSIAVRVEPTDVSFREAITFATEGGFDALRRRRRRVDHRHREGRRPLREPPGGLPRLRQRADRQGEAGPGPLKPLIAVPTTSGTGARPPASRSSTTRRCTRRPASRTGG
jgi:hydroxyacid-oxoacid transhydrogenase